MNFFIFCKYHFVVEEDTKQFIAHTILGFQIFFVDILWNSLLNGSRLLCDKALKSYFFKCKCLVF